MPWLKCPECAHVVEITEGQAPVCDRCGHGAAPPAPAARTPAPATPAETPHGLRPTPPAQGGYPGGASHGAPPGYQQGYPPGYQQVVYQQGGRPPVGQGTAIAALLLNLLIWPGLGTLIGGDQAGWAQGFMALAAVILFFTIIGIIIAIPLIIAAYVWAIVSSVELLRRADAQPRPPAY